VLSNRKKSFEPRAVGLPSTTVCSTQERRPKMMLQYRHRPRVKPFSSERESTFLLNLNPELVVKQTDKRGRRQNLLGGGSFARSREKKKNAPARLPFNVRSSRDAGFPKRFGRKLHNNTEGRHHHRGKVTRGKKPEARPRGEQRKNFLFGRLEQK